MVVILFTFLIAPALGYYSGNLCSACDGSCYNECQNWCGAANRVYYYNCEPLGDNETNVYCDCALSVPVITLLSILPLICTIWLVLATFATAFFIRNAVKRNTNYLALVQPKKEEFIVARATIPYCYGIFTAFLGAFSCCTLIPFIVIDNLNFYFTRFHFAGERITFTGRATTYCTEVFCVNFWMNFVTCGCWTCFGCSGDRYRKWVDSNSQLQNQVRTGLEPVFFFRSRPPLVDRIVAFFGTCCTCGILGPFFFVKNLKTTVSGWRVNNQRAIFSGSPEEYASKVCLPGCLFSWVTCGMYNLLGFGHNKTHDWIDTHLQIVTELPVEHVSYPGQPVPYNHTQNFVPYNQSAMPPPYNNQMVYQPPVVYQQSVNIQQSSEKSKLLD